MRHIIFVVASAIALLHPRVSAANTSSSSFGVTSEVPVPGVYLTAEAIAQSVDGGFVSVGSIFFLTGGMHIAVIRWNNDGTIGWVRRLDADNGAGSVGVALARTPDGGFVTAALANGPQYSLIAKLTDGGAVSWQRRYGGGPDDALNAIAASADGSIYAAGYRESTPAGSYDGWLMKLNALGTPDWSLRVEGVDSVTLRAIQPLESGGAVAVGFAESDAILLEVSSAGEVVKQTVYHEIGASSGFSSIRPLAGGGYIVGGSYYALGRIYPLVLKLDAAGAIVWQRGLRQVPANLVTSVDVLPDGSIYAHVQVEDVEDYHTTPILTGWDPNGALLWLTYLGESEGGVNGVVSDDGGIAVAYGTSTGARLARLHATGSLPSCASVSPVAGSPETLALSASPASLEVSFVTDPAPAASFTVTSVARSVAATCSCSQTMTTPIYVSGRENTEISWASDGFGPYDVVRGDLSTLKATGGDFTAALNAIPPSEQCLDHEFSGTLLVDGYDSPPAGTGYFYLVRGENGAGSSCPSAYDESVRQVGRRDPEIAAATGDCP